jgi:outer membrane protein TolC
MNQKIKGFLSVLMLFFLSEMSFAQEKLTLSQAIAKCLLNNYQIQITSVNKEIAINNNTWGNAGKLPSITFSTGSNNNLTNTVLSNPFALPGVLLTDNLVSQLDLGFTIFNGFRVNVQKSNLEKLQSLAEGNLQTVIQAQIQSLMMAYHYAIFEKEKLNIRIQSLGLSKERLRFIETKKEYGQVSTFEYLQEKNAMLSDSATMLQQELSYKNALKNLNLFMGEDVYSKFILTDSLKYSNTTFEYSDLETKMLAQNQNIKNQVLNQAIFKTNVDLAQTQLYPTITLNTGLNSNVNSLTGVSLPNEPKYKDYQGKTAVGYSYGAYINLNLRFNIFNGGQVKRNIQQALLQEKIASLTLLELQNNVKNSLNRSFDQYQFRRLLIDISEENLKTANLNLQMAEERFKSGLLNSIEMRTIQLNYLTIALNKLDNVLDVIESETELLRLVGGIVSQ